MADAVTGTADRAFGRALIAQLPALRRYATGLTGNTAAADDLVQDCIERALRRAGSLDSMDRLASWLRAILFNLFVDGVRQRRVRGTRVDMREMENDIAHSTAPQDRSAVHDFMRATMALSAEHRQILLLVGVEELSYREVAEELGVPIGTVMSRLARAREKLRAELEEKPPSRVLRWVGRS
jgi:RNA polymerase sigma-70 factor (ECF subfamily)